VTTFQVTADPRSAAIKVRVQPTPGYDHFLFSVQPSKFDTTITVVIEEGTKLVFKCVHSEGHTQVRLTQTFQLPFDIQTNKIEFIPTSHAQDIRVNM